MKLVLDAGALVALERGDRPMWTRFKAALATGRPPVTNGAVVGQAWRGRGPRQALLATALTGTDVRPLDDTAGRAAGQLLALTRGNDVVDASLVLLAEDGDVICSSDPDDVEGLARRAGLHVEIVPV